MELGPLLFVSAVGISGLGLFWFRVVRPILEDLGLFDYEPASVQRYLVEPTEVRPATPVHVKHYAPQSPAPIVVTSSALAPVAGTDERTATDGRTDEAKNGRYWAADNLQQDITKEAVIMALLAAGWKTTDIRAHLKGANDSISLEVEVARARLSNRQQSSPDPLKVWGGTPREEQIAR